MKLKKKRFFAEFAKLTIGENIWLIFAVEQTIGIRIPDIPIMEPFELRQNNEYWAVAW